MSLDRQRHWEDVYKTKDEKQVSWFEERPAFSLELIRPTGVHPGASIIDIGGGASRLADALLNQGFAVTVLDLSEKALAIAKARLGILGAKARWVVADVTKWEPSETYDVWHDRATFHFLTAPEDRIAYAERVCRAVHPGGHVIIGRLHRMAPSAVVVCKSFDTTRHRLTKCSAANLS
jgi:2-polyprenyl-3-methyl-5-hydroxy-6-metoxy-1,4-benzoquinol methylase